MKFRMRKSLLILLLITICSVSLNSQNLPSGTNSQLQDLAQKMTVVETSSIQSSIIWTNYKSDPKGEYVVFRKSFELANTDATAQIQLFADSRYLLWINGKYVLRGPCRFYPKRPEYDVVDVKKYLKKGKNTIAILVHTIGKSDNGRIMHHAPGVAVVLKMSGKEILHTDATWKYYNKTMYLPSARSWNTIADVMDARIDNAEWISPDYNDSSWTFAVATDGAQWGKMFPSELPLRKETELKNLRLLPSGESLSAKLPIELTAGQEALVDFGTMAMVYTCMDLDADEGSQMTMRYALRYKNGKPDEMYGKGNVYTARAGHQSFMTTDQYGSHYMLVKCDTGRIKIQNIKITNRHYPFNRIGKFACSDTMITRLWDMAVKTIEVTCDDAYGTDARERNEWIQDACKPSYHTSRVSTATLDENGKQVYSDTRLLKNMIRHTAQSQTPDGQLIASVPTGLKDCHYLIEDYSCQWVAAIKLHYDATNDKEFVREMWPNVVKLMKWYLDRRTPRGLLLAREYTAPDNPFTYITGEGATVNAYFYDALIASEQLATLIGEKQKAVEYLLAAQQLKTSFNKELWNDKEIAYNSAFINDTLYGPTVHSQLIPLQYGLVPSNREASARQWFLANFKNPGVSHHGGRNKDYKKAVEMKAGIKMTITYFWVFNELYRMDTEQEDQEVISEIRKRWRSMVLFQPDAGTLSEAFLGENGEGRTESCHNYGATPAYFLSSYVLGVRRIGDISQKQLLIEPRLADLTFAKGVVVTEYGAVPVSWKKSVDGKSLAFSVSIPKGIKAEIHFPGLSEKATLTINGNILPISNIKQEGRWMVIQNVSGECSGSVDIK